jgi:hypothetical protein
MASTKSQDNLKAALPFADNTQKIEMFGAEMFGRCSTRLKFQSANFSIGQFAGCQTCQNSPLVKPFDLATCPPPLKKLPTGQSISLPT